MSLCKECDFTKESQYDVILKQLQKEIDTHIKAAEAKFLIQDGKIAMLCNYIKDNLSNTLREMLFAMDESGELDKIITDTVLSELEYLKVFNTPQMFGAFGDGKHDDTVAIQKAINKVKGLSDAALQLTGNNEEEAKNVLILNEIYSSETRRINSSKILNNITGDSDSQNYQIQTEETPE